jgi:hypothetical protein
MEGNIDRDTGLITPSTAASQKYLVSELQK